MIFGKFRLPLCKKRVGSRFFCVYSQKYSQNLLTKTQYEYIIFYRWAELGVLPASEDISMQLQLEQIFNIDGAFRDIDYSFEPDFSLSDDFVLKTPVSFKGRVANNTGIVSLSGTASFSAVVTCSRCAEEFSRDFTVGIEHLLAQSLNDEDNDDYIVTENAELDLSQLICEDIVLSLPPRFLCSEDCKGLCSRCGKNLNNGPCGCKKEVDPRMAALLELLEE